VWGCGGYKFSLDKHRTYKELPNRVKCHCGALHYPHHIGSSPFCLGSPRPPTKEEIEARYGYGPDDNLGDLPL